LWSELRRRGVLDAQGVIGLFVGIELMVNGWTWLMLAFALKGLAAPETPVAASRREAEEAVREPVGQA
jgi:hypothetical protein